MLAVLGSIEVMNGERLCPRSGGKLDIAIIEGSITTTMLSRGSGRYGKKIPLIGMVPVTIGGVNGMKE
jgi:hypothetical protein